MASKQFSIYLCRGSYVFTSVCLFVCLSLLTGLLKTNDHIFMKFYGMVGHNPRTSRLDFGLNVDLLKNAITV